MKKVFLMLLFLAMAITTGFAVVGCNDETEQDNDKNGSHFSYEIAYAESYIGDIPFGTEYANLDEAEDYIGKVDSASALRQLSAEKSYPFFDENDSDYSSELAVKIRSYDEEFFKDKSLVLLFIAGKLFDAARIDSVAVNDNAIEVTLTRPDVIYEVDYETTFAYIVEVSKGGTENISEVKVKYVSNGTIVAPNVAYTENIITQNQLRSIAYYFHEGREYVAGEGLKVTDYKPIIKDPEQISSDTESKIKRAYIDCYFAIGVGFEAGIHRHESNLDEDSITLKYLGTYNGYIAVSMEMAGLDIAVPPVEVGGVTIVYPKPSVEIVLWKE